MRTSLALATVAVLSILVARGVTQTSIRAAGNRAPMESTSADVKTTSPRNAGWITRTLSGSCNR